MKPISRRAALAQGALLGSSLTVAALGAEPADPTQTHSNKTRIVVTGGHPGDPEYGCGGTIARLSAAGHDVALLYLNRGDPSERPDRPAAPTRVTEAAAACWILGARPLFAGQFDAHSVVDAAHYDAFAQLLEAEKPDVVFTHWPIDNHADHRAMSMLVYEAWLRSGKRFALYYYEVSNGEDTLQFSPTDYVDISVTENQKRAACYAHASQSPDRFYALQELVSRMRGIESGHRSAEAFIRHLQSPRVDLP